MAARETTFDIVIVPGSTLSSQPWWPELHAMINESFLVKDLSVFPPTWTRLNVDPTKGAEGLANELGNNGILAVAFTEQGRPKACGGLLPFRGENWINEAFKKTDAELANVHTPSETCADWETCCFCVHPSARGHWLSRRILEELMGLLKSKGGKRIFTNYARDETGAFWPRLGFEVVSSASGMLPKGFQTDPGKEGLRANVYFQLGVKSV